MAVPEMKPELLDAPEVGEAQHVEGAGGGHRAEQHAGAAASRGDLEGLPEAAAQEQLLLVAEQEVDAVVDADPDHDRDEHHREQRQVPDHQGRDPDRPAQADGQDDEHEHRLAHAQEGHEQQAERERERQHAPRVSLSRKAATISSLASAGLPVTPTATSGNSGLSEAITARMPSMACRSPVKLPRLVSGSARMKSSRWSSDRK